MKPDQTRVGTLLIDTVSLLCRNGLNFTTDIKVQGLLGITIDGTDVFLVHFNETFTENQPAASAETPLSRSSTSEQAAVTGQEDNLDDQNLMAAKPTFRKTGFPLSAGPRHRYGALPLSVQARRRARQLGTSISQRMRVNSKSVEVGLNKSTDLTLVADSDEKPDCSGYANIKTEADMEELMQNIPEEQGEVILVESEDGALVQDGILPSDMDSSGAYLKAEESSEFSIDPLYSYSDSYEQFNPSSSDLVHGARSGDPGTFSSYGSSSSDIKPMIQMQTCSETWNTQQLEWNSSQNSQTIASKYGRIPVGLTHDLNNQDNIEHMGSSLGQLPVMHRPTPTDQHVSLEQGYGRRNTTSSKLSLTKHANPPFGTMPANRQISALLTPSAVTRQTSSIASHAKMTYTVTKYVCNLCDATFNHQCTLLTHQVRKHGRKKNARRGRPSMCFPTTTAMPF